MKSVKDRIKSLKDNISDSLTIAGNETQWLNSKIQSIDNLK